MYHRVFLRRSCSGKTRFWAHRLVPSIQTRLLPLHMCPMTNGPAAATACTGPAAAAAAAAAATESWHCTTWKFFQAVLLHLVHQWTRV